MPKPAPTSPSDPASVADATGRDPVTHLIQVQCDLASHTVSVARPAVTVYPGDTVVWSFSGIPEGWTPWIQFRQTTEVAPFAGPLSGISQSAAGVWGLCTAAAEGAATSYEYRASIQQGVGGGWGTPGSMLWSGAAQLRVPSETLGEEIVSNVILGASGTATLEISPRLQTLTAGDTFVLEFPADLPGGAGAWRPRLDFHRYEGAGEVPNRLLGPFQALTIEPGRIRGTGNNDVPGLYFFQVALVNVATGQVDWVSSDDPVVDNRGGVIGPGGG
jgi:hypothetical protein